MPPRHKKGGRNATPKTSSSTPSSSSSVSPSSVAASQESQVVVAPKPLTTDHGRVIVQKQCIRYIYISTNHMNTAYNISIIVVVSHGNIYRCASPAKSFCSKCKFVWYCSGACQTKDWKLGHRLRCAKIIELTTSDIVTDDPSLEASIGMTYISYALSAHSDYDIM